MKLFAFVLMGMASQLSATSALASDVINALQGDRVQVKAAYIVTTGTTEFNTTINVYADVVFSNSCLQPELIVASGGYVGKSLIMAFELNGAEREPRFCPMHYDPIVKRVLVRQIWGDIMPGLITVNGVEATLAK